MATPFAFYGTSQSSIFVNMNGNITFGGPDSDFSPTEAEMLSGLARIAPAWDDWIPPYPAQGTVRAIDNLNFLEVEWFDVIHAPIASCGYLGSQKQDSNTFCVKLFKNTNDIRFLYGGMALCQGGTAPSISQIVGISPGNGLSAPNNGDLSAGGAVGASQALYEDFSQAVYGSFDLGHLTTGQNKSLRFLYQGTAASFGGYILVVQ